MIPGGGGGERASAKPVATGATKPCPQHAPCSARALEGPSVTTTGRQNACQLSWPSLQGSPCTCTDALDSSWLDTVTTYSLDPSTTDMALPLAETTVTLFALFRAEEDCAL